MSCFCFLSQGKRMNITYYGNSVVGKRDCNQDAILMKEIDKEHGVYLFAVADGMGGYSGGEVASKVALESLEREITAYVSAKDTVIKPKEALYRAIVQADADIGNYAKEHQELYGMGTTLTCVLMYGGKYIIGNIGDSRTYLIKAESMEQMTKDHSFIQEYKDKYGSSQIDPAIAQTYGNQITRYLMGQDKEPDIFPLNEEYFAATDGTMLLLCSDGLLPDKSGYDENYLADLPCSTDNLELAGQNLIQYATNIGSTDNISVILIELGNLVRHQKRILKPDLKQNRATNKSRLLLITGIVLLSLFVFSSIGYLVTPGEYKHIISKAALTLVQHIKGKDKLIASSKTDAPPKDSTQQTKPLPKLNTDKVSLNLKSEYKALKMNSISGINKQGFDNNSPLYYLRGAAVYPFIMSVEKELLNSNKQVLIDYLAHCKLPDFLLSIKILDKDGSKILDIYNKKTIIPTLKEKITPDKSVYEMEDAVCLIKPIKEVYLAVVLSSEPNTSEKPSLIKIKANPKDSVNWNNLEKAVYSKNRNLTAQLIAAVISAQFPNKQHIYESIQLLKDTYGYRYSCIQNSTGKIMARNNYTLNQFDKPLPDWKKDKGKQPLIEKHVVYNGTNVVEIALPLTQNGKWLGVMCIGFDNQVTIP